MAVRIVMPLHACVDWAVGVEAGKLRFPDVSDVPGIYRFDLGENANLG
ncbi:MAG: hypothetical protein M3256_07350 [Actinomycetota bacterium]|nr:hypothetical protein [Actinomycetota bacterium]